MMKRSVGAGFKKEAKSPRPHKRQMVKGPLDFASQFSLRGSPDAMIDVSLGNGATPDFELHSPSPLSQSLLPSPSLSSSEDEARPDIYHMFAQKIYLDSAHSRIEKLSQQLSEVQKEVSAEKAKTAALTSANQQLQSTTAALQAEQKELVGAMRILTTQLLVGGNLNLTGMSQAHFSSLGKFMTEPRVKSNFAAPGSMFGRSVAPSVPGAKAQILSFKVADDISEASVLREYGQ